MLHIVIGAAVGALVGAGATIIAAKVTGRPITWQSVLAGAAGGAVGGAVTAATLGAAGLVGATAVRAGTGLAVGGYAGGATTQATENVTTGRPALENVNKAGLIGAGTAVVGGAAGKALAPVVTKAAQKVAPALGGVIRGGGTAAARGGGTAVARGVALAVESETGLPLPGGLGSTTTAAGTAARGVTTAIETKLPTNLGTTTTAAVDATTPPSNGIVRALTLGEVEPGAVGASTRPVPVAARPSVPPRAPPSEVFEAKVPRGLEDVALGGERSPTVAEILNGPASALERDPRAGKALFDAAVDTARRQGEIASDIASDLRGSKVVSITKRPTEEAFVERVLEKSQRKGYTNLSQQADMSRGRISVDSGGDVEKVVARLQQQFGDDVVEIVPPRPAYPRYHVVVKDPETGILHEWQVGTNATERFLETPSVRIPPTLKTNGRPDFHDVKYDLLDQVKDPALRQRFGLDALDQRYDALLKETGRGGVPRNYDARYAALNDEISSILARMESEMPGYLAGRGH